jgi:hypothetical protein
MSKLRACPKRIDNLLFYIWFELVVRSTVANFT